HPADILRRQRPRRGLPPGQRASDHGCRCGALSARQVLARRLANAARPPPLIAPTAASMAPSACVRRTPRAAERPARILYGTSIFCFETWSSPICPTLTSALALL